MTEPLNGLVDLDDTGLELADSREDLRGFRVIDLNRDEIGQVDGLLVDEAEHRVRFLEVGSGGLLGLGRKARLIPANAITRIGQEVVHVDTTREQVAAAPKYDPAQAYAPPYEAYLAQFDYYGLPSLWSSGYVHPLLPPTRPTRRTGQ